MILTRLNQSINVIKRSVFGLVALFILMGFPSPFLAPNVSAADTVQKCNPVQPASSGTTKPTGSSAGTYTYNKCTGLYENDHFTFNPATRQYTAKDQPVYVCNQATWTWQNTNEWVYVSSDGKYEQRTVNATPPAGSVNGTCQAPVIAATPLAAPSTPSSAGTNSVSDTNSSSTGVNDSTKTQLTNNLSSTAQSGAVNVQSNTSAGNATSGDASSSAVVINSVSSSSAMNLGPVATFTENINGNVNGDITIDPTQLQPASANVNNTNNANLNIKSSGQITNNIDLSATSGNVNASQNTSVGDATSGNAQAMANVVNMLNTYVSAGQSFVGTININGSLNGNILMPPSFLASLQASGAPKTTISLKNIDTNNITDSSIADITNQINSQATSGQVSSSENAKSGNATSGYAGTSVDIYNLTGQKIVGQNGLLVFVNVMGKWVGVITGAPAGANAYMLGGQASVYNSDSSTANISNNNSINNNINVSATSGDVTSRQNTIADNATSGNATTGVSLANYSNDYLNYTGWFGLLFINVFGSWNGNFGATRAPDTSAIHSDKQAANHAKPVVFKFTTRTNGGDSTPSVAASYGSSSSSDSGYNSGNYSLASSIKPASVDTLSTSIDKRPLARSSKDTNNNPTKWYITAGILLVVAILMFIAPNRKITSKR